MKEAKNPPQYRFRIVKYQVFLLLDTSENVLPVDGVGHRSTIHQRYGKKRVCLHPLPFPFFYPLLISSIPSSSPLSPPHLLYPLLISSIPSSSPLSPPPLLYPLLISSIPSSSPLSPPHLLYPLLISSGSGLTRAG
ncbi:MAG: hypothetical protein D5R96_04635, partial [Methanocalculus sp. MSAO_Arc2]